MKNEPHFQYEVFIDYTEIGKEIALKTAQLIQSNNSKDKHTVIGLDTGSTVLIVYRELIRLHRETGLDFSNVIFFSLDEFYPLETKNIHSHYQYLMDNLLKHLNVKEENLYLLDGNVPLEQVEQYTKDYEKTIKSFGGIDILYLGIRRNGIIGFNERGSSMESPTRKVNLNLLTRKDASSDFFGEENVPHYGLTMGIGTVFNAKTIFIIVTGEHKAAVIKRMVEDPASPKISASLLQKHPNTKIYLDQPAASELIMYKTPWLVKSIDWDEETAYRAVINLALKLEKSILKITPIEYEKYSLIGLIKHYGDVSLLNETIHKKLLSKILTREKLPTNKRVLIFSPHPDDDVICAAGMMDKMVRLNNTLWTAYMTSGNLAVFDHDVERHLDFVRKTINHLSDDLFQQIKLLIDPIYSFLKDKKIGMVDIPQVQHIKAAIRESEAMAACKFLNIPENHIYFLNLPFYQTGKVEKKAIGDEDVSIVLKTLEETRPDLIFVAGDLSDPHGTHRMCNETVYKALDRYTGDHPQIWLYRGAWQEWDIVDVDAFIPLSVDDMKKKILSIFKHESQKDKALFPGPYDDREFWQRTEERNISTAQKLNTLGLPEYYAMEAFVIQN